MGTMRYGPDAPLVAAARTAPTEHGVAMAIDDAQGGTADTAIATPDEDANRPPRETRQERRIHDANCSGVVRHGATKIHVSRI